MITRLALVLCRSYDSLDHLTSRAFNKAKKKEKIMNNEEMLCLKYNDFKENVSLAFGDLRQDKEFTDVTLVCEDGLQVEAHKLVLVASSPFF